MVQIVVAFHCRMGKLLNRDFFISKSRQGTVFVSLRLRQTTQPSAWTLHGSGG